jgi:multidrug efflux pump subunit AcrA (membrane-fusion protein)
VLLVPNRAVSIDRDTGLLYVETPVNGEVVRVEVEIGLQDESFSEVLRGLEEGDRVVIEGSDLADRLRQSMGPGGHP